MTSHAVREEWRARIAAEYTSAAITQHLVLWLIPAGAPPELIPAGLVIVGDALVHARMSFDVYAAARDRARAARPRTPCGAARARHAADRGARVLPRRDRRGAAVLAPPRGLH